MNHTDMSADLQEEEEEEYEDDDYMMHEQFDDDEEYGDYDDGDEGPIY